MKKLMMFAAAMTIVGGAYASNSCTDNTPVELDCLDVAVWDFVASGKTANEAPKGAYKTVQPFKLKGALVSVGQPAISGYSYTTNFVAVTNFPGTDTQNVEMVQSSITTNSILDYSSCCIEAFDVYLYDKEADVVFKFDAENFGNVINKLTVFGKNFDTVLKPGRSTSIESDILWAFGGPDVAVDGVELIDLQFVGFGKAKRSLSKATPDTDPCGDNSVPGCDETISWPSWNGWFTGSWGPDNNDFLSLNCEELCDAIAGGTWSAKYNKKLSAASDVESAIEGKFKANIVNVAEVLD